MLHQPVNETADPVLRALEAFFAEHVPAAATGPIDPAFSLLESGHLDSLSMLQLTTFLADTFGIEFGDEDFTAENFATAGSLSELVRSRLKEAA